MKKFLTFVLVLAMVLSVSSVALAAEVEVAAGTDNLQAAITAAASGDTIKLTGDITLTAGVTIPAGKTIILDLNGCTVSMVDSSSGPCYMITNNGNLTIMDSSSSGTGKLSFKTTTPSSDNSYSTSTIGNAGTLTVKSGTIESLSEGAGGAKYAIDTIWYASDVTINIEGGKITSKQTVIRQVLYSTTAKNTINVSGGEIEGGYAGIQTHSFTAGACLADVNISGGTITASGGYAYYTYYSSADGHGGTDIDITGGEFTGDVFIYNPKAGSDTTDFAGVDITDGEFNDGAYIYTKDSSGSENSIQAVSGGIFGDDVTDYVVPGALAAEVTTDASGDTVYAVGAAAIEEAAEEAAKKSGAEKVTVTVTKGDVAFDKDDLPGGVTVKNAGGGNVTVDGTTPDPSFGVVVPTPVPEKPASSGSGISVTYNGGNSFSTSNPTVPTGVEIDGVPVTFNGTGSNFSVGCISSDAKWVTVRWNSTSVTTNFTPDGLVECTTVSIPKTGDMSIWAAIAQFLGF